MNAIKIYGDSKLCHNCHLITSYFDAIGEPYTFYDLAVEDRDVRIKYKSEIFELFKGDGVPPVIPVVLIDENDKIIGYGAEQIDKINEFLAKR